MILLVDPPGRTMVPLWVGAPEAAAAALRTASRKLDKAASKGVIHKNQAANRKSGIAARVKALLG